MPNTLTTQGTIISLQLCPGHRKPMHMVEEAEVITNLGLKNDKHALPDSSRQILLIEKEALDELGVAPGQVKENITTKGIQLMGLTYGNRLSIGNGVILEITKACSPCSRMEELRPGLLREIVGKRGMLARVIQGGVIRQGDTIKLISK